MFGNSLSRSRGAVLFLLLIVAGAATAQEKLKVIPKAAPVVRKPAATADDALTQLVAAGKTKDIEGILFHFTDDAAKLSREMFKLDDDYRAASQALALAVGTRFGAVGENEDEFFANEADDKSAMAAWCAGQRLIEKTNLPGGKVKLKLESTQIGINDKGQRVESNDTVEVIAVKQGDGWKLIPPQLPSAVQADEIRFAMPRLAQVSRDLSLAVKSGKYETREQVTAAYAEARKRVILSIKNPIVFKAEAESVKR